MATARSFRGWVPYRLKRLCFALLAVILGLAAFEGLCSLGLLSWDLVFRSKRPVAERVHTDYDEELGWVNRPSVQIKDLYGPGRTLTINAQGFRATRDYPVEVPEGKVRILASGDSFTLGYGVGDADTWCAALERTDPRLEIVNMGQGGEPVASSNSDMSSSISISTGTRPID